MVAGLGVPIFRVFTVFNGPKKLRQFLKADSAK